MGGAVVVVVIEDTVAPGTAPAMPITEIFDDSGPIVIGQFYQAG